MSGKLAVKDELCKRIDTDRRSLPTPNLVTLEGYRHEIHKDCMACGNPRFRLEFACDANGMLVAQFDPTAGQCSYQGVVHGGLVALLADEAMTCCLLAHGVPAVTGELRLRYLQTVKVDRIELRTRVTKVFAPLYHLECEMWQYGVLRVRATGRFLNKSTANDEA